MQGGNEAVQCPLLSWRRILAIMVPHLTIPVFKFYFSFAYRVRKHWSCKEKVKLFFICAKSTLYLDEEAFFFFDMPSSIPSPTFFKNITKSF